MRKLIFILLVMAVNIIAYAQNDCNCSKTLEQLIFKVENEYPGFGAYAKDSLAYTNFKNHLIELSKATTETNCFDLLKSYTSYFKHGHLSIVQKENNPGNARISATDTVDIDIDDFSNRVNHTADSIEGIWTSGGYKVGVLKRSNNYIAFIISSQNKSWKQNEIKFRINQNGKAVYFMGDHSQEADTCLIIKNSILYFPKNKVTFVKTNPQLKISSEDLTKELNKLEGFSINPISKKTILFEIASFGYEYTDMIKKLIEDNKSLLESYDNLIIDVRGNGGGADYSFRPILPYLYTNPVRHLSGEYLVTQTLINSLTNWVNTADKEKYDDIEDVKKDIKRMVGNVGQFIPYSTGENFGFTKQDSVYPFPKNIAILMNGRSASSTENFILNAKQSKKVKTFGTPTYGSIDYLSVIEFDINCDKYILYMPTVRMLRAQDYPLDNIGIQPDIFMDKYVEDWIQYAKDYLEKE
ncbi:MAG: hypothetical protein K8H86_10825 [Ignavibacteriaceae bacterium]|nr:hypothetical protein [Ignavibacteriaceae bacterium]